MAILNINMVVYEHFFWNYAFFYRKPWAWKVGVGGALPDLIYMVAFLPKIFSYQSFKEWMHDPLWDTIWDSPLAKSVHSFVVCGAIIFILFVLVKKEHFQRIAPFGLGWGMHIFADTLTHVSDGYPIFFPLSDYRFPAPISYWERAFHAREFFVIGHSLMGILFMLWLGTKLKQFFKKKKELVLSDNCHV